MVLKINPEQTVSRLKHKPTNVGRIALERQAGGKISHPTGIRTIDLPLHNHMLCRMCYFPPCFCYAATDFILATSFRSESNRDHSKMKNESMKKSLEKSKNVLEEKCKMVKRKICIKRRPTRLQ